ncbi:hypothetical protein [Candidatus Electronema sp. TJ]|uniref:hypothetical protein n=1 Tax=Candidatus Electronema sp. TJ TaxID=3401573 RepID=UPI003AA8CEF3
MDGNVIDFVCDKLQWLLDHPEVTWSGSGIYALSLTGSAVLAGAVYVRRRKKKSSAGNEFTCNGGEQNIGQGQNAVGKHINNYFGQPLKQQRTLIIAMLAAAGVIYILPGASGSGLSSLTVVVDEPELLAEMVRTGISPMHPIKKKERLK